MRSVRDYYLRAARSQAIERTGQVCLVAPREDLLIISDKAVPVVGNCVGRVNVDPGGCARRVERRSKIPCFEGHTGQKRRACAQLGGYTEPGSWFAAERHIKPT